MRTDSQAASHHFWHDGYSAAPASTNPRKAPRRSLILAGTYRQIKAACPSAHTLPRNRPRPDLPFLWQNVLPRKIHCSSEDRFWAQTRALPRGRAPLPHYKVFRCTQAVDRQKGWRPPLLSPPRSFRAPASPALKDIPAKTDHCRYIP